MPEPFCFNFGMVEAEGIAPSSADNPVSVSTSVSLDLVSQNQTPQSGLLNLPARNRVSYEVPEHPFTSISPSDGGSRIEEQSPRHRSCLIKQLERNCYWQLLFCRLNGHGSHARCSNPTTHVEPGRPRVSTMLTCLPSVLKGLSWLHTNLGSRVLPVAILAVVI